MTQSINTNNAVIVVGDRHTAERPDLAEKAAEQGAVIAEICTFEFGEAASHDDLAEVEAVVAALSRAIGTRTDVWVPFPMQDLCREEHIRRLSLVLQRHGLDLLMGRELVPCPLDGGYNAVDVALRVEVRAVDALDHAAMATAGVVVLSDEIELALAEAGAQSEAPTIKTADEQSSNLTPVGEKFYGTSEVAKFFGKSVHWVYRGMRDEIFTYPDGSIVEPIRIGKRGRLRFTLPVLLDMALSCYRRGILSEEQLEAVLAELSRGER
jgi:hypothetical protein